MEDKSHSASGQIAEVHFEESKMRLKPHLVITRDRDFRVLRVTIEEILRYQNGKYSEGTTKKR